MTTPMTASTTMAIAMPITRPRSVPLPAAAVGWGVDAVAVAGEVAPPPEPVAAGAGIELGLVVAPHGLDSDPGAAVVPAGG